MVLVSDSPIRSVRRLALATGPGVDPLPALCRRLSSAGRTALLVTYSDCGERDVRVQVCEGPGSLVVELLGPYDTTTEDDRWYAVQISATSRAVWRGPARSCPDDHVLRFIDALLHAHPEYLAVHYQRLG